MQKVKAKLEDGNYERPDDVAKDIRLIWSNCILYNSPGSEFGLLAASLGKKFEERFSKVTCNISRNTNDLQQGCVCRIASLQVARDITYVRRFQSRSSVTYCTACTETHEIERKHINGHDLTVSSEAFYSAGESRKKKIGDISYCTLQDAYLGNFRRKVYSSSTINSSRKKRSMLLLAIASSPCGSLSQGIQTYSTTRCGAHKRHRTTYTVT